jgi:hypothetical protein
VRRRPRYAAGGSGRHLDGAALGGEHQTLEIAEVALCCVALGLGGGDALLHRVQRAAQLSRLCREVLARLARATEGLGLALRARWTRVSRSLYLLSARPLFRCCARLSRGWGLLCLENLCPARGFLPQAPGNAFD